MLSITRVSETERQLRAFDVFRVKEKRRGDVSLSYF